MLCLFSCKVQYLPRVNIYQFFCRNETSSRLWPNVRIAVTDQFTEFQSVIIFFHLGTVRPMTITIFTDPELTGKYRTHYNQWIAKVISELLVIFIVTIKRKFSKLDQGDQDSLIFRRLLNSKGVWNTYILIYLFVLLNNRKWGQVTSIKR